MDNAIEGPWPGRDVVVEGGNPPCRVACPLFKAYTNNTRLGRDKGCWRPVYIVNTGQAYLECSNLCCKKRLASQSSQKKEAEMEGGGHFELQYMKIILI